MRKLRQDGSSSFEPEAEARGVARGLSRKPVREASTDAVGGQKIRCAIYTRKSSEEGLEQEFNSLDAQREACEAFIKSQRHEGWSIRIDQAVLGAQGRLAFRRAFARTTSFRMIAVRATLAGFPVWMRWAYLAFMSGLKRAATRAGM